MTPGPPPWLPYRSAPPLSSSGSRGGVRACRGPLRPLPAWYALLCTKPLACVATVPPCSRAVCSCRVCSAPGHRETGQWLHVNAAARSQNRGRRSAAAAGVSGTEGARGRGRRKLVVVAAAGKLGPHAPLRASTCCRRGKGWADSAVVKLGADVAAGSARGRCRGGGRARRGVALCRRRRVRLCQRAAPCA
jgi:hypothetical protein